MPYIKTHYHPFLFVLITICAMAELGLTAFLISAGNENHDWPSARYHSLLILFEFNAVWTTMFGTAYLLWIVDGAVHFLASIASSIVWLVITTVLWARRCCGHDAWRAGWRRLQLDISFLWVRERKLTLRSTPRSKQRQQLQRNPYSRGGGMGGIRIVHPNATSNVHVAADEQAELRE